MTDKNYCSLERPASMCNYLNEDGKIKDADAPRCTYFPQTLETGKILNIKDLDKIDKYNYCRYLLRLKSIGVKLTQREIAADLRISLRDVNLMAKEFGIQENKK